MYEIGTFLGLLVILLGLSLLKYYHDCKLWQARGLIVPYRQTKTTVWQRLAKEDDE